jgi:hypothetical protein
LGLNERWQVGGDEDDELFFGVLTQITSDNKGNIYLLDAQLSEVFIFSSSGEYIRSIGREGEGPGEFRRPSDLFLMPDGNVAVLQRMPGKIVLLSTEGDPVGDHPLPDTDGMRMFFGGKRAGDGIVLAMARTDVRDFAAMETDEKTFGINSLIWATDDDGRVYTSDTFDAYRIQVWSPDGTLERVIERDYEPRVRSDEEKERAKPRVRVRRGNRAHDMKFKMSDTDRDIQRMYPREDGTLWVLSSHGAFDAAEGTIATFDIYDIGGRFTNQITLLGDGDFVDDGFHFVGDRLFVVKGFRTAVNAMMGGREGEPDTEEDPEPMSVICYGLDMFVKGGK